MNFFIELLKCITKDTFPCFPIIPRMPKFVKLSVCTLSDVRLDELIDVGGTGIH